MHSNLKIDTKAASASIHIEGEKRILWDVILPGELILGRVAERRCLSRFYILFLYHSCSVINLILRCYCIQRQGSSA